MEFNIVIVLHVNLLIMFKCMIYFFIDLLTRNYASNHRLRVVLPTTKLCNDVFANYGFRKHQIIELLW